MRSPIRCSHPSHPSHPGVRESRTEASRSPRASRDGSPRLLVGALAAVRGLALCTVVVLLFWVASSHPENGADGPMHVAASVWLLAHGADLLRTGTGGGEPVPVGLTPLLLLALPARSLSRAVRRALPEHRPSEEKPRWKSERKYQRKSAGKPGWKEALRPVGTVATGYLAVGGAVLAYAAEGPVYVEPLRAGLRFGLFVLLVTALVTWFAVGRPGPRPPRAAGPVCRAALRAVALGTAVLTGGGLLLLVTAVARHGGEALAALERLGGTWSGQLAVVLLALSLLPNAVIWSVAYGLGPGFTLGAGSAVTPLAASTGPGLPPFPLLAAVPPAEAAGGPTAWATGAVPLAAALALGWSVGRAAAPVAAPLPGGGAVEDTFGPRRAALVAALAACGCGAALGALAGAAGGTLGNAALDHVGPSWWATGLAALCWSGAVGVPTACTVRAWRLRAWGRGGVRRSVRGPVDHGVARSGRGAGAVTGTGDREGAGDRYERKDWHETGARRVRWAAMKEASGGLMADFPARGRE